MGTKPKRRAENGITVGLTGTEREFVNGMIRYTGLTPAAFARVAVIREANRVYGIAKKLQEEENNTPAEDASHGRVTSSVDSSSDTAGASSGEAPGVPV